MPGDKCACTRKKRDCLRDSAPSSLQNGLFPAAGNLVGCPSFSQTTSSRLIGGFVSQNAPFLRFPKRLGFEAQIASVRQRLQTSYSEESNVSLGAFRKAGHLPTLTSALAGGKRVAIFNTRSGRTRLRLERPVSLM